MATSLTGAAATIAHDLFITPADVLKQRMQLDRRKSVWQTLRKLLKNEGFRQLYRSYPITVTMNMPYAASMVTVNENLKVMLKPKERAHKFLCYFFCAGVSGKPSARESR